MSVTSSSPRARTKLLAWFIGLVIVPILLIGLLEAGLFSPTRYLPCGEVSRAAR